MTYEQIKEYLSIILDMEKNIYIQKNTLENMYRKRNLLGQRRTIQLPRCSQASADYGDSIISGMLTCIVVAIVIMIIKIKSFDNNSGLTGAVNEAASIFGSLIFSLIIGAICGAIVVAIVANIKKENLQKEYDKEYSYEMKEYDRLKNEDEKRVRNENIIRGHIQQEIEVLEEKYGESKKRLEEFYNYNIVDRKYWHNIVAISSFYQYLSEKRTYSLEFDQKTGDRGAYNIYNEEAQRGIIIIQLGKVLDKLDQVIENQYMLQNTLRDANRKINSLSGSINQMSRQISSSIQEHTAIQAYNAERTQAELGFMNTMNIIYNWH